MHYKKKSLTPAPSPPQQLGYQSKKQQLFLRIVYHPDNMKLFEYQHKFKENILKPKYHYHISNHKNKVGNETKIDRMVVAYSHPPNLGNNLSSRKLKTHIRPPTYPLSIAQKYLREREKVRGLKYLFLVHCIYSERYIILFFISSYVILFVFRHTLCFMFILVVRNKLNPITDKFNWQTVTCKSGTFKLKCLIITIVS